MSRAYRIRVAASERRYIVADDRVCTDIELLPILAPSRLRELLARELKERGFSLEGTVAKRTDGDIEIEVDLDTARVSARIELGAEVERSASTTVAATDRTSLSAKQHDELREQLAGEVEQKLARDEAQLQQSVTAKLEAKLKDLQREMDEVSNRVAGAALKEKAAQLGEIVELLEDETGSITIKVKV